MDILTGGMMKKEHRKALIGIIATATNEFYGVGKKAIKLTPKEKAITKAITSADFGCSKVNIAILVSAIIGKDLVPFIKNESKNWKDWVAVVHKTPPKGRKTSVGTMLVLHVRSGTYGYNEFFGYAPDRKEGFRLYEDAIRMATPAEIGALTDTHLQTLSTAMKLVFI